ncbi:MAG: GNAT family N-acetyltransferase [Turicibacter sp.]
MIHFEQVNRDNFWECVELSVADEQLEFVTSNGISIAQSKLQPECIPLVVYEDDKMIGFVMYCIDEDDSEYWIYRLMIDQKYQGAGYGTKTLRKLIDLIKQDKQHRKIFLGVHRESIAAVKLYQRAGFKFNGQVFGSEHMMRLDY